jgi:hypothetical protein
VADSLHEVLYGNLSRTVPGVVQPSEACQRTGPDRKCQKVGIVLLQPSGVLPYGWSNLEAYGSMIGPAWRRTALCLVRPSGVLLHEWPGLEAY